MEEEIRQLSDFPKVQCPFIRQTFAVDKDLFKKFGSALQLKKPEVYLVVNIVNPGFEWVFDDPDTIAVEKFDGTNIKIKMEKGRLVAIQNRLNVIDPLQLVKGKTFIMEGIHQAAAKEYIMPDGEYAGELIGPKLQGNPYKLDHHVWYPFERAINDMTYRSFLEHERTLSNFDTWFKDHLHSRFYTKRAAKLGLTDKVFAEGVIFYNRRRKAEGKSYMAKLRRNMFPWYYADKITILNYDQKGLKADQTKQDDLD